MSGSDKIKILCVDDHPVLQEGLPPLLENSRTWFWQERPSGQQAIRSFREIIPDVTLMDLRLPDMSGIDTMIAIRAQFSDARIVILSR
jgi:DNA-binding NarL/FixJ family response regulator